MTKKKKEIATKMPNRRFSKNVKSSPVTGPEGPRGFQEVNVPRFRGNGTGWW